MAPCVAVRNAAVSTVERMDNLTKMFTYELIRFILIINCVTIPHSLVRNESIIALLEGKFLNMTESIFYMQFKMTRPDTAKVAQLMVKKHNIPGVVMWFLTCLTTCC